MTTAASLPADLTVVVPCYNEAENVAPMVARLDAALRGVAWEVVFVDDSSPDGTADRARALAARDPRVRCLRRVGRRGLASACVEGALSSSAPFVAVMDGDLQHDEAILPAMLAAVRTGRAEVAVGSRHVGEGTAAGGFSPSRARVSGAGAWLAARFLPTPVADPMSGYFLLPRPLFESLAPGLTARGFKILLDLLLTARRPLRVVEVPYAFRPRVAGESKLDAAVLFEFAGLLADKALGRLVPWRFLSFLAVGAVGIGVHMATLWAALAAGLGFGTAQALATLVAMVGNFALNNRVTYRDVRLRGAALWRGLAVFVLVCGVGAYANLGVADLLLRENAAGPGLAGAAGALLTAVWNYAVSSTLVWRTR